MKDVLLATFNDKEPAQNLQNRLQQAGVRAILSDDTKLQRFWFISEPLGAFHLQVLRDDHQKAARLLEQWDQAEAILKDAVRCPVCHSTRVEFPQLTRKFVLPSVGSLLMAIGLIPREFYCCDCQYTWPPAISLQPSRDALGWPAKSKLWHPEQSHPKS